MLRGVLNSAERPDVWERTGSGLDDYDPDRVGWRYTVPPVVPGMDTIAGRRVFDASRPGLDNGGHDYGDSLTPEQRLDLLEYLEGL